MRAEIDSVAADYDAIVIGAGPAGWAAALQGSKIGRKVAIVERNVLPGGSCIHTGTIPSKTLRETILELVAARRSGKFGVHPTFNRPLTMSSLMRRKDSVIEDQVSTLRNFLDRNQIPLIHGSASILSPTEVRVANPNGENIYHVEHIFITTGSRPRRPESIPFDDRLICDSDSILTLDAIPRSLAVLGGGVIGSEYACMFAALGVKVTLIDRRHGLMRFLDQAMVDALYHHMREKGILIMLGEEVDKIEIVSGKRGPRVGINLKNGRHVNADRLLAAAGRESNTGALGLENVGIETDGTGLIKVDESFTTTTPTIHAAGDVIGFPALAGTGMHQGRMAMLRAFGKPTPPDRDLPIAVYTIPEISMVGKTEEDCRREGIAYEVGVALHAESARGQINDLRNGVLKIVFRREDHVLLGVHMIGANSSELVHIGMAVVHAGGTVDQLADTVFNYPTLSEAYRVAALDGLNRL